MHALSGMHAFWVSPHIIVHVGCAVATPHSHTASCCCTTCVGVTKHACAMAMDCQQCCWAAVNSCCNICVWYVHTVLSCTGVTASIAVKHVESDSKVRMLVCFVMLLQASCDGRHVLLQQQLAAACVLASMTCKCQQTCCTVAFVWSVHSLSWFCALGHCVCVRHLFDQCLDLPGRTVCTCAVHMPSCSCTRFAPSPNQQLVACSTLFSRICLTSCTVQHCVIGSCCCR
jgi:hypothetical protein